MNSIGEAAFEGCSTLRTINIPSGLTDIQDNTFKGCSNLNNIHLPNNLSTIGNSAFQDCSGLGEIRFESTTPPTVVSSNAWSSIPRDCKIYVPQGTLSAYTSATNYPSSSTYTYIEY